MKKYKIASLFAGIGGIDSVAFEKNNEGKYSLDFRKIDLDIEDDEI